MAQKIGLFGFGTVGQGLYEILQQSPALDAEIVRICVKNKEKPRPLPADRYTFDPDEILEDPEINVVVELIDDSDAALQIITKALEKGKAVVTANKRLLAEHFETLFALREASQQPLLYEAACGGSIPIIRNLEEYYDNDLLSSVEGILNGTSNYLLGEMQQKGISFLEALHQAQEKGLAESDPSLDVSGRDAKYKLSVIIAHAFGVWVEPLHIFHAGIRNVSHPELKYAREKGWRLKLIARACRVEDRLYATVLPRFIQAGHPLYQVKEEYNGILLEGAFSEKQCFTGKGAGAWPTASAVLSDISALRYQYRYEYRKWQRRQNLKADSDFRIQVYFRYQDPAVLTELRFDEIQESYRTGSHGYLTGWISVRELQRFFLQHTAGDVFVAELPESKAAPNVVHDSRRLAAYA